MKDWQVLEGAEEWCAAEGTDIPQMVYREELYIAYIMFSTGGMSQVRFDELVNYYGELEAKYGHHY